MASNVPKNRKTSDSTAIDAAGTVQNLAGDIFLVMLRKRTLRSAALLDFAHVAPLLLLLPHRLLAVFGALPYARLQFEICSAAKQRSFVTLLVPLSRPRVTDSLGELKAAIISERRCTLRSPARFIIPLQR